MTSAANIVVNTHLTATAKCSWKARASISEVVTFNHHSPSVHHAGKASVVSRTVITATSSSFGGDITSPYDDYDCVCGPRMGQASIVVRTTFTATPKLRPYRDTMSGGVVCSGSAIVGDPNNPWTGIYAEVYHLIELSNGTTGEYKNSVTPGSLNGTGYQTGGVYPQRLKSLLYKANEFDRGNYIIIPDDNFPEKTKMTISAWVRLTTDFMNGTFYLFGANDTSTSSYWQLQIGKNLSQNLTASIQLNGFTKRFTDQIGNYTLVPSYVIYNLSGTSNMPVGCWQHVAVVWDYVAGTLTLYLQGVQEAQLTGITDTTFVPSSIGSYIGRVCDVDMFDVRLSLDAKTAAWINAEWANTCNTRFYSCGTEMELDLI